VTQFGTTTTGTEDGKAVEDERAKQAKRRARPALTCLLACDASGQELASAASGTGKERESDGVAAVEENRGG
jgi:hypothetical protein